MKIRIDGTPEEIEQAAHRRGVYPRRGHRQRLRRAGRGSAMNVTITFKNRVESFYTRADGSAALSKDVLELTADGSATVLWSRLEFDRGGGDDGTKPRVEKGYSREVLRLPPAAALGPGGSLDEFWTRAAQHCDVVEVELDGKLVYPF